jgi:hypothetical protein
MTTRTRETQGTQRLPLATSVTLAAIAALGLAGCTVYQVPPPAPRVVYVPAPQPAPPEAYEQAPQPEPQAVVSVYVEPPISQPPPIAVPWAPPPMLVEAPTPMPYAGAVWIGGYWVWEGNWVWAAGRWAAPPQPSYVWVHPYYENRNGAVIFVTGHWGAPGVAFVPPPPGLRISLAVVAAGAVRGPAPIGPQGVFVPAPPGSRIGLIVPAPIGTPPAVVTGAPPVVNVGMRIQNNVGNSTTINNTHITNITNVTIVAPPGATAGGRPYQSAVPAQAHLAAALPPVVRMPAPVPASTRPITSFVPGRPAQALPPAQMVHPVAFNPAPQGGNPMRGRDEDRGDRGDRGHGRDFDRNAAREPARFEPPPQAVRDPRQPPGQPPMVSPMPGAAPAPAYPQAAFPSRQREDNTPARPNPQAQAQPPMDRGNAMNGPNAQHARDEQAAAAAQQQQQRAQAQAQQQRQQQAERAAHENNRREHDHRKDEQKDKHTE